MDLYSAASRAVISIFDNNAKILFGSIFISESRAKIVNEECVNEECVNEECVEERK